MRLCALRLHDLSCFVLCRQQLRRSPLPHTHTYHSMSAKIHMPDCHTAHTRPTLRRPPSHRLRLRRHILQQNLHVLICGSAIVVRVRARVTCLRPNYPAHKSLLHAERAAATYMVPKYVIKLSVKNERCDRRQRQRRGRRRRRHAPSSIKVRERACVHACQRCLRARFAS